MGLLTFNIKPKKIGRQQRMKFKPIFHVTIGETCQRRRSQEGNHVITIGNLCLIMPRTVCKRVIYLYILLTVLSLKAKFNGHLFSG